MKNIINKVISYFYWCTCNESKSNNNTFEPKCINCQKPIMKT